MSASRPENARRFYVDNTPLNNDRVLLGPQCRLERESEAFCVLTRRSQAGVTQPKPNTTSHTPKCFYRNFLTQA